MSGAGFQGAGRTSAGYGTSPEANAPGGSFLRDKRTGKTLGSRSIDPRTKDYALDEHGRTLGLNSVRQAVQLSISTTAGTAAARELGHKLASLDRITPNFERAVFAVLSEAIAPLVRQGLVQAVSFTNFAVGTAQNGLMVGAVYGRFKWRDLTTDEEFEENV